MSQIGYKQVSLNRWEGRLINKSHSVDVRNGTPAGDVRFDISENPKTLRCTVLRQAGSYHSRRFVQYADLDAAQAAGAKWAARRFKIEW